MATGAIIGPEGVEGVRVQRVRVIKKERARVRVRVRMRVEIIGGFKTGLHITDQRPQDITHLRDYSGRLAQ
jgi:hypothetical protein